MHFAKFDDSPMFRQQLQCLEEAAESLRARCWKFYKGCRKYTGGLGEEYDGNIAFASSLESFGGGCGDPSFVALGGPVMAKFTIALREICTYKEVLRSQVEHMLNDRLLQFLNVDINELKEARKRFDKASSVYDQGEMVLFLLDVINKELKGEEIIMARDKFLSLRKSTKIDVATVIEEELHNARSSFEEARFNLVSALNTVEAKKRFEFLQAVAGIMDAHLRYFQQGYQLLHQMEPFICEVLDYTHESRESYNKEQISLNEKMQEYKKHVDEECRLSLNGPHNSPNRDPVHPFSRIPNEVADAVMESATNGKVQIIRQGYLSKRSSNLRADWKRRYFVLDSRGMLYYYRKPWHWSHSGSQISVQRNSATENGSGLLSRWLSSHYHGGVHDERSAARHAVNLLTSTIKTDADQTDLRFCFRIISPSKNYTLQAENALDQMDWMEKITGVIASLLSVQTLDTPLTTDSQSGDLCHIRDSDTLESPPGDAEAVTEEHATKKSTSSLHLRVSRSMHTHKSMAKGEKPIDLLKRVCGNDKCADCGKPEPDWASLNLGILVCIECSGVHRNLGVHKSKVRSLTFDVKVWDPSVITMFQSLGNLFANSVWEELMHSTNTSQADDTVVGSSEASRNSQFCVRKPAHNDPISLKERYIHAKYSEKVFVQQIKENQNQCLAQELWECVRGNDKKAVYRHIVISAVDVNSIWGQPSYDDSLSLPSSSNPELSSKSENQLLEGIQDSCSLLQEDSCSLLHQACLTADMGMVELLLQYGADINASDTRGRTPLHYCTIKGKTAAAKVLLARGADPHAVDRVGNSPLKLASELADVGNESLAVYTNTNR